jgi:RNA polymerase-binding protein DksA
MNDRSTSGGHASLKKKEMAPFKETLEAMKRDLLRGVKTNDGMGKENNPDEVKDLADLASDSYDRELAFGLSETERARLAMVEKALDAIGEGTYGLCVSCGKPIAAARLKALPFARLCIDCKSSEENPGR